MEIYPLAPNLIRFIPASMLALSKRAQRRSPRSKTTKLALAEPISEIPEREIGNSVVVQIKKNGLLIVNRNTRVRRRVNDFSLSGFCHRQQAYSGSYGCAGISRQRLFQS